MKKNITWFVLISIILGIASWLSLSSHFLNVWETSSKRILLSLPVLFFLGGGISFFLIRTIHIHLGKLTLKVQMRCAIASILVGVFLLLVIPVRVPEFPVTYSFNILATGETSDETEGSEVWLTSISTGKEVFSKHLKDICQGEWLQKENYLVSQKNQPSELICSIRTSQDIIVHFRTTPRSGKVALVYGDQKEELDLYSAKEDINFIQIKNAPSTAQILFNYTLLFSDWLLLSLILLITNLWLLSRENIPLSSVNERWLSWFWYALPMMFSWTLFLLAFWPGSMTTDSLGQWQQVLSGEFTDFHPASHTLTIWLLTRIWFSPASVAFTQILALSGVIGWGVSMIHHWGAPNWLTWVVVGLMAISPANGMMVITLWKDIPYSISIVALTILVLQIVNTKGKWINNHASWLILGFVAGLVSLFRHNGILVAFGTLSCLLLSYRNHWKRVLTALIFAVGFWGVTRGPIYGIAGVTRSQNNLFIGFVSLDVINRHLVSGTPFLPEEKSFLFQVRPSESDWPYDCYRRTNLLYDGNLNTTFITNHSAKLVRLAITLTLRDPFETFEHSICRNAYILQITQPLKSSYQYAPAGIYKNSLGLETKSKLTIFQTLIRNIAPITGERPWNWLIWRTAIWMYLLIFASIIASIKSKSWKYLLISAPILLNSMSLLFSSGLQSFRYVYPTLLVSILLSGYLLLLPKVNFDE